MRRLSVSYDISRKLDRPRALLFPAVDHRELSAIDWEVRDRIVSLLCLCFHGSLQHTRGVCPWRRRKKRRRRP